jgi:hypothetical protein
VLPHADPSVCSLPVHTLSRNVPCALLQALAVPSTISAGPSPFAAALPALHSVPNCHSNPITQRVRRKRQRLPPSLLIENASGIFLAFQRTACPRRFRSRLATTRPEACWRHEYKTLYDFRLEVTLYSSNSTALSQASRRDPVLSAATKNPPYGSLNSRGSILLLFLD